MVDTVAANPHSRPSPGVGIVSWPSGKAEAYSARASAFGIGGGCCEC